MTEFLVSLVPSVGVLLLLWVGLRAIFQADRRERAAMAKFEAGLAAKAAAAPASPADDGVAPDTRP